MGWFDDAGITTQPDGSPQPQAPAAAPGGYDYAKFQAGWLGAAPGTNAQDFINAHPEYTQGATTGKNGEFINLPGGQSFDAVKDFGAGGQNKMQWGDQQHDYATGRALSPQESQAAEQAWAQQNPGGSSTSSGGGGQTGGTFNLSGSSGGSGQAGVQVALPNAPTYTPFSYPTSSLGNFTAPSDTPTMQQQSYNPAATPTALSYTNLPTPEGYQAKEYTGMTAAELASDPSYQFRLKQGQDSQENILAHAGALRTGNAAKALSDYGQQSASQEYAAADARARQTNQMNNATSLGAYQTNAQTGLAYNQNANQNALNFGQANYNQAFQTNQANNQGSNAAIAANNATALAQQNQQYGQAANTYGLNQAAQQQGYTQGFNTNQANNAGALNSYQAQVNAALGQGNLSLGFQNSNNSYALGQGNLAQGNAQLGQQAYQFGVGQNNYLNNSAWQQNMDLANLGNPGAPNSQTFGQQQGNTLEGQGNANAAGQVGSANAWNQGMTNVGNAGMQTYAQWLASQPRTM